MADNIDNMSEDISYDNNDIVILTDEEGEEYTFRILCDYETDEGDLYCALAPVSENEDEDNGDYIILKVIEDEEGAQEYVTIDDDDEFDRIGDIMDDILNSEDFDI